MTFTMLRGIEPFLQGSTEGVLLQERIDELRSGAVVLEAAHPGLRGLCDTLAKAERLSSPARSSDG
jgi:hypothetical protein